MPTTSHTLPQNEWVQIEPGPAVERTALITLDSQNSVRIAISTQPPEANSLDGIVLTPAGRRDITLVAEPGEAIYAAPVAGSSRVSIETTPKPVFARLTGWADYKDTEFTEQNPALVRANRDTRLPNNGGAGVRSQEPDGIKLVEDGKITGRTGDALLWTMEFDIARVRNRGQFDLETWIDIGGDFGPIFRRYDRISGTRPRNIVRTTGGYTLDTWEKNGGTPIIRTSVDCHIWNIRVLVQRTHAAAES